MLKLQKLTVSIGKKKILNSLDYTFETGKIYAIMGPNGSGKSTLANAVMGNPIYDVMKGSNILFEGENIAELEPHERSQKGIFISFQSPVALSGVTAYQLLRYALHGSQDPLTIRQKVQKLAKELGISEDLLSRSLNDGFSGGERKKMEVLQAAMLQPKLLILDEVDTGVDVDALKSISKFIKKLSNKDMTILVITHYTRILKYLKPDTVIVMKDGNIVATGTSDLANSIEKGGYEKMS